jgi:hypothetical protein
MVLCVTCRRVGWPVVEAAVFRVPEELHGAFQNLLGQLHVLRAAAHLIGVEEGIRQAYIVGGQTLHVARFGTGGMPDTAVGPHRDGQEKIEALERKVAGGDVAKCGIRTQIGGNQHGIAIGELGLFDGRRALLAPHRLERLRARLQTTSGLLLWQAQQLRHLAGRTEQTQYVLRRMRPHATPQVDHLAPLVVVRGDDAGHNLLDAEPAVARLRGKVRAPGKGVTLRGERHGQGPDAPTAVEGGVRCLVAGINVRPLVAIDLDRHEVLIDQRRNLGMLITLAVYDMAPMTPDGPNVEPDRAVERGGKLEGLGPPLLPGDGLLGGRAQIGTGGLRQIVVQGRDISLLRLVLGAGTWR